MSASYRFHLQSGRSIDLGHPQYHRFHLADIAHGLSRVCHFGGQTSGFFSVAQHCMLVEDLVMLAQQGDERMEWILPVGFSDKEMRLAALLHDAAEAFVGDITKPLQMAKGARLACWLLKRKEKQILRLICQQYGLRFEAVAQIKPFDVLARQIAQLRHFPNMPSAIRESIRRRAAPFEWLMNALPTTMGEVADEYTNRVVGAAGRGRAAVRRERGGE